MAGGLTIKLEGAAEVAKALQKVGVDVQSALEAICEAGAMVVQAEIASNAPATIGEDIVLETTEKSARRVTVETGPSEERWYARFLEYGTPPHDIRPDVKQALRIGDDAFGGAHHPGIAARPFVRPAADEKANGAQQAMGSALKKVLD